jgi:hypothetical protein
MTSSGSRGVEIENRIQWIPLPNPLDSSLEILTPRLETTGFEFRIQGFNFCSTGFETREEGFEGWNQWIPAEIQWMRIPVLLLLGSKRMLEKLKSEFPY